MRRVVDWTNNRRMHEPLDYVPPVEIEAHCYGADELDGLAV